MCLARQCPLIPLPSVTLGNLWLISTRKGHVEGQEKERDGKRKAVMQNNQKKKTQNI